MNYNANIHVQFKTAYVAGYRNRKNIVYWHLIKCPIPSSSYVNQLLGL